MDTNVIDPGTSTKLEQHEFRWNREAIHKLIKLLAKQ